MPIQFKANQGIGVFFLNGVVLVLGLQQHWLQRLRFPFRLLLLHLHFLRIRAMGLKGLPGIFQRIKRACRSGSHPQFLIKAIMVVEFPIGVPDDGNFFGIAVLHGCGRMVTGHNAILHGFFLPITGTYRHLCLRLFRGWGERFFLVACRLTAVHKVKQGKLPAGNAVQIRFFFRLLEDGKGAVHILMHLGQNLGPFLVTVKIQGQRRQSLIHCSQQVFCLGGIGKSFRQFFSRFFMEKGIGEGTLNFLRKPTVKLQDAVCHPFPLISRHPGIVARR